MALEAVVFSQDHPLTSYNNSCRDQCNIYNFGVGSSLSCYDLSNYSNPFEINIHNVDSNQLWDDINNNNNQQRYVNNSDYSSPEGHCNCTGEQYLSGETETPPPPAAPRAGGDEGGGGRRKRRRRSCKNEEEVEQQRMTHITVERNRRKQMNEYLAVIRSLMPPSYAQRGDQASIVGGAINYVKELEQHLQSLEAHKRTKHDHHDHDHPQNQPPEGGGNNMRINDYFTPGLLPNEVYPNGSTQQQGSGCNSVSSRNSVGGEEQVQVTMVETHANLKILAKKQPKQLLRLVAGFQGLRLSVLHLNVTSLHPNFLLYSFSLKVEEGCEVNTVEDITAAANHILSQIQEEAAVLL